MKPKFTTLRVSPETRDRVNAEAEKNRVSVEDLMKSLLEEDRTKQIILIVDAKKYYGLINMAKWYNSMHYTDTDSIKDMLMFALECTTDLINKKLEKIDGASGVRPTGGTTHDPTTVRGRL